MQRVTTVWLAFLAAFMCCAIAASGRAWQTEPAKPAEPKPAESKPKNPQPADARPGDSEPAEGSAAQDVAAKAAAPSPQDAACLDMAVRPDLEMGLDKTLTPLTYDEAMSNELGAHAWQRIRQLHRLHQELEKHVRLSNEQRELLNTRFGQIYATIVKYPERSSWRGYNYPPLTLEEKAQLEMEVQQAETSGDRIKADTLRMRILQGTFGTDRNMAPALETTVLILKDSMDVDQRAAFTETFDRWYGLEVRQPMDVPTRMLIRTLKDPSLKLDPAFVQKAEDAINAAVANLPPPPGRRQRLPKLAEELKAQFFAELPPDKRAAAESTFASLMQEREIVERYSKEMYKKRVRK